MHSENFWSTFGSITIGSLILLVLIRHFSEDVVTNTAPTIHSTKDGRIHLFRTRLITGSIATFLGIVLLTICNLILSVGIGNSHPRAQGWIGSFVLSPAIVTIGAIGFFVIAACVCDIFKNQPIAMAICGIPYAISYLVNADVVKPFDLFWLFRYGFFTELTRGRHITSLLAFWAIWYLLLMGSVLAITIQYRKGRKEL